MTDPLHSADPLTGSYQLDVAHSRIGFAARHAMVTTVRGSFGEFAGTAALDYTDPTRSHAEVTIAVASLGTGSEQRDGHLRSPDFFDVETYPEMSFHSTAARQLGDDTFRLVGDLTIKDVTRPISIDFSYAGSAIDPYGNQRVGFEGTATVNRTDWGLTWNAALETGGVLVSDKVTLTFDVSAIKQAVAA